ncbi:MAG: hypothetical protein EXS39_00120 [Opitutaceae bacterium]|nr:hypothetical protein [Opitutaceae bacterium]
MSLLRPRALIWALVLACAAALAFVTSTASRKDIFFFEITVAANDQGIAQLFYDAGRGFNEQDSNIQPVSARPGPKVLRFGLPPGPYQGLRFDPINREATVAFSDARIVDLHGAVIRRFSAGAFRAAKQVASVIPKPGGWEMRTTPGGTDPILEILLDRPFVLRAGFEYWLRTAGGAFVAVFLAVLVIAALPVDRIAASRLGRIVPWSRAHPSMALFLTAVLAVAWQCHPVLFLGKSFVSPNTVYLLYDTFPTLPGYQGTEMEDTKGADVGAMMWQHLGFPVVQREALFDYGELPLWNRYDLGGAPMLGQGQSMFGDPLNWLTILTKSAAWAWDARFLLMRVLFAFGTGLVVWRLARHLGAALLITGSVVFIGFFAFRFNHPAILSVCWAPWVLVAWCWLLEARSPRARNLSLLALIAAHGCLMTSGTVKEAYMLAACLDLAGGALILLAAEHARERLSKLGSAMIAGFIFVLLAAPQWITFLDALKKSHTNYEAPAANQLAPWQLIGFFDDLFTRQLRPGEVHFVPSTNFVILFGLLWSLAGWRENFAGRRYLAVMLTALVPFALVFGLVPASWIVRLPFIGNIIHVHNTFSCPLLILTAVLAGFGLASAIRRWREPGWMVHYVIFVLLLGGLAAWYFGSSRQVEKSPFFQGYVAALFLVVLTCPVGAWLAVRQQQRGLLAAVVAGGLGLLLWRHGQYLATPFDPYVMNPPVRVDLRAPSPAVAFVNAQLKQPARTVGLGYNLFPGYNQMLAWESIYGVNAVRNKYLDELADLTPMRKIIDWVGGPGAQEDIREALPMHDLMNVRHYLAAHHPAARELPGRRWLAGLDLDVYESPTAWPRAFFTDTVKPYETAGDFVRLTLAGDRRPFAAIQKEDVRHLPEALKQLPGNLAARAIAPAYAYRLTANTTSFTIAATQPGVIVLTESYYPGDFQATLDGAPVVYFRVNHAFKGIYVDHAGTYQVSFRYWPEHLTLGLWLCAAGILFAAAGLILGWHPHQRLTQTG